MSKKADATPKHAAPAMEPLETPKRSHHLWIIPVVIVALLAVVYVAGARYFEGTFLPNTTVDGQDVSLRQPEAVDSTVAGYLGTISGDKVTIDLTASSIGLAYNTDGLTAAELEGVSPWMWPIEVFGSRTLATAGHVTFDEQKLTNVVTAAVQAAESNAQQLENGGILYDSAQHRYVVDKNANTQHVNPEAVVKAASESIRNLEPQIRIGEECLVSDEGVESALAQANTYVSSPLKLKLSGQDAQDVDADMIAGWVTINPDLSVTLDEDAIRAWCHGDLSQKLDTVGTARTFTNPRGETYTTNARGPYGWNIDGEQTANLIIDALGKGQAADVEIPTLRTAAQVNPGGQDWPNHYIEVSISQQHAWFYGDDGSTIWESDVVTGLPANGRSTVEGVFTINNKTTNTELRGPIVPETNEPEWISHVDFWMSFYNNAAGFHNAPWRSSFGGSIYKYDGSHGCINLPYDKAQQLYDLCKEGDVVVIHQ